MFVLFRFYIHLSFFFASICRLGSALWYKCRWEYSLAEDFQHCLLSNWKTALLRKTNKKLIYKAWECWPRGIVHGYSLYLEQCKWHFHYMKYLLIYASISKLFFSYKFENGPEKKIA